MPLLDYFEITPEEKQRLDTVPFHATPDAWQQFAAAVHEQACQAYADGHISPERALEVVWGCALGCRAEHRFRLLALTARRMMLTRTRPRRRMVANPKWVKVSAARLVQMLHEAHPDEPLAPNEHNEWTTWILEQAIEWLTALKLCKGVRPRVLYRWFLEHRDTHPLSSRRAYTA